MATNEGCGTCLYWREAVCEHRGPYEGDCRRHPPVVLPVGEHQPVTRWPVCDKDDWCGEWERDPW